MLQVTVDPLPASIPVDVGAFAFSEMAREKALTIRPPDLIDGAPNHTLSPSFVSVHGADSSAYRGAQNGEDVRVRRA